MTLLKKTIVITAPSGTGKTTITKRLVAELEELEFSVSYTTRPRREAETNGVNYWFVTKPEFEALIHQNKMIEWADVFGCYYGTGYAELERAKSRGKSLLLEIDVQGWKNINAKIQNLCSLFILPPSMEELWNRLISRGTETREVMKKRFATAKQEIELGQHFDHFVINDNLERSYQLIKNFLLRNEPLPLSKEGGQKHCHTLLKEFETFKS